MTSPIEDCTLASCARVQSFVTLVSESIISL